MTTFERKMVFWASLFFGWSGIALADWDKCPVHCECPRPEVVRCNDIKIRDEISGQYKQLDEIPMDIPSGTD